MEKSEFDTMLNQEFDYKKYQEIVNNLKAVGCKPKAVRVCCGKKMFSRKLVDGLIPLDFEYSSLPTDYEYSLFLTTGIEVVGGDYFDSGNEEKLLWDEGERHPE